MRKTSFIRLIKFWGILILLAIGVSVIAVDIISSRSDFNSRADQMREDYIARQKEMIKREVERVVDMVNSERTRSELLTETRIKSRVYEAYAVAKHIYQQNNSSYSTLEIQQMIIDVLGAIRFDRGTGYFFISRPDGEAVLFPSNPELEGVNLIDVQDTDGQYLTRDMINIIEDSGEGYYRYHWTKPDAEGEDFQKISFIKQFEPYDWFIGTGLYIADVEEEIKSDLLKSISRIRFGEEGYVFVNRFNGDALVSNGEYIGGTKKLWEVFSDNPDKTRYIYDISYEAALNPEGDFIYYSLIKLTDPDNESPKTSFIYGIPELEWYVGAGVYLDDVETDIALIYAELNKQIKVKVFYFFLIILGIVILFLLLFNNLTHRLQNDFNMFVSFFGRAAFSDEEINRRFIKFTELDLMAENANKMLQDKIRSRQELMDERELLSTTIHSIGDGVITTDISGRIEIMNMVAEKLTGWNSSEARGKHLLDIFPIVNSGTREVVENPVMQVILTGEIATMANNTILQSKDGTEYQIADSAAPIKDTDGNQIGVVLVFRDVTREYRMKEELRESEKHFRTLVEQSPFSIHVHDSRGYMVKANKAWADLWGVSDVDSILGGFNLLTDSQLSKSIFADDFKKLFSGEQIYIPEIELFPEISGFPGRKRIVKINAYPLMNSDGSFDEIVLFNEDITEQKQTEEELRNVRMLKSVGTLAGGIAHDFNNILMGLFGNISLVKMDLPREHPSYKYLDEMDKTMNRATSLTTQLLTFAKGGAPVKEAVSLGQLIEDIVLFDLSGSKVKPVFDLFENLYTADVDRGQIQQVISNLTINASQAMPEGGHLFITVENADLTNGLISGLDEGKYIKVIFRDEGEGIDPENFNRIFEPYFSTKHAGSGLGLATVYSIIHKHGGRISLDSELNIGSTFTLHLPASTRIQVLEEIASPERLDFPRKTGRILIMDDEIVICRVTSRMLEKIGFSVETALDGKTALDLYRQASSEGEPYDLVIMDLTIPGGMGGKELIRELLSFNPKARAIASSGYAEDPVMANYSEHGFKGIIAKPYNMNKLYEVIDRVLNE